MVKTAKLISSAMCGALAITAALTGCFQAALPAETSAVQSIISSDITQNDSSAKATLQGQAKERPMLIPCGTPFGIKLRSDGVMVVAVTENSPADACGIRKGDIITSVNGSEVHCNEDITAALLPESTLLLRRGASEMSLEITPSSDPDSGESRIGAWVRDSAAGIGTMTFCDPSTGSFAGLGHAVSDATTGDPVPLASGEITEADIYDIVRSVQGTAGELCGALCPNSTTGVLNANTSVGVFGTLCEPYEGEAIPMAFRQEVHSGSAYILSTISGTAPRAYSIEIERINLLGLNGSKGMVIRITDPDLLTKTGGIVRGMSGSPIIQDGRLVGAITHVLVNDPQRGYAVFAESMLDRMYSYP